jgi:hypothetical protein
MPLMSARSYGRLRGADPRAIRRAISSGVIKRNADGLLDSEEADRSWASTRRASRLAQHQHDDAGTRSAQSKVALAVARLREARRRFEAQRAKYVDRDEAIRVGQAEAAWVLDELRAAPNSAAARAFAAELGIDIETARVILRQFFDHALLEIGDLPGQAVRDAERA